MALLLPPSPTSSKVVVRSVWANNMESEVALIRSCVDRGFCYATVDTEFPGNFYRPPVDRHHSVLSSDDHYAVLKANVDALHVIQLGITLTDAAGNLPDLGSKGNAYYIWEVNFREFDERSDLHVPDSIGLLQKSGLDLPRYLRDGVDARAFGAIFLLNSGLFFINDRAFGVNWITFQGSYDLGYLIKTVTGGAPLPPTLEGFISLVYSYMGDNVYDVKHIVKHHKMFGGLEKVAEQLGVKRSTGCRHQAGSDSLLTSMIFTKMLTRSSGVDLGSMANFLPDLETSWFKNGLYPMNGGGGLTVHKKHSNYPIYAATLVGFSSGLPLIFYP